MMIEGIVAFPVLYKKYACSLLGLKDVDFTQVSDLIYKIIIVR